MLVHSIRHARSARCVGEVLVSTDDPHLAELARQEGAVVIDRPAHLSDDLATSESALLHVLDSLAAGGRPDPELVVFLQCTSPIRRPDDIDRAVAQLREERADSLFSATPFHELIWRRGNDGPEPINYDFRRRQREQDMAEQYRENGSLYVFKPDILRRHQNRLGGRITVYQMGYWESFQLDTDEHHALLDWRLGRPALPPPAALDLVVFDFDGVMTDNRVIVDQDGREAVLCNRADGLGLAELARLPHRLLVLSTEVNSVVQARCAKLNIPCRQGVADKAAALGAIAAEWGIDLARAAYLGNDRNDLEAMALVGWPVAVSDAWPEVRRAARLVLSRSGGHGAVREFCDWLTGRLGEDRP